MRRILIANRGEIACRIIRACKSLGIETVAVYSEADAKSLHVELADFAEPIGPAPAAQSYLNGERILEAALRHGADGVHPGYGFLSENTGFARAAEAAGVCWIGPAPESIEAMGDKQRARAIAQAAGVPTLPGSRRFEIDALDGIEQAAQGVGYPLLVKATGGGGGIGMRRVDTPEQLLAAVAATQALAAKAFKDGTIYLERLVARARHIEIQVFGHGDGTAVHLFERECSVQRRFQKIIEESPAPGLPAPMVERMAAAAVALAAHQRYRGPGTVEFIVDADTLEFFFLEMNTRIQVEHPVTEMVTGWDLVQAQIRLAAGTFLPLTQAQIAQCGAAIECRLYAENPAKNFFPSPGPLTVFRLPLEMAHVRVDTGVREGDQITPFYDPMIAKLIVWGKDREAALARLREALASSRIGGVKNNVELLAAVAGHADFIAGEVDTGWVERERQGLLAGVIAV
ncbi:acetyl-CoA carboxylase biotin carboxylase subunit [Paucibacter sp. PLA-PC-4]|uniref:acetyl-CoA carboxylase biotin carboxylase subunit n=1 Tax=Paucibacter sp. PLA-PC-4 TaxID=2993655 RepID=UPI0022497F4E|nr:biotin carboxylase N-terminal domain-containing protein [Paucibacter sp. PLA-PC-4]MCX2860382.1 acetyl-CoA carboxylase biotin carboxylase subunit [Paucibacter sp. PLA-PC-4]